MPAFDGTGPRGLGSRTGWGLGRCPLPAQNTTVQTDVNATAPAQGPVQGQPVQGFIPGQIPVYGVGRGGIPRGGGGGFCRGGRGRGRMGFLR